MDRRDLESNNRLFQNLAGLLSAHCYAERLSLRFRSNGGLPWTPANAAQVVQLHPERLEVPLHWRKPKMVFVCSMADLFHERVPFEFISDVWSTMLAAHQHTFQLLTKRPERILDWWRWHRWYGPGRPQSRWPSYIWIGTSVENQHWADRRIPLLLQVPAAVRFLSVEPLLKKVDLTPWLGTCKCGDYRSQHHESNGECNVCVHGASPWDGCQRYREVRDAISWTIVGGESGPGARPMNLDWARSIRDQCIAVGVPFFYKQGSGPRPGTGRELDGRTWDEMPRAIREEGV